jgi:Icc-related predicted phosphoesterase
MKVAVCSDLHLEFGDLDLQNTENADVLILGGDIFVANDLKSFLYDESSQLIAATSSQKARSDRYYNFIMRCTERFPHVVFIMGNHEHYHGDFADTANIIRGSFEHKSNFHFLDNEWKIINGVLFYGGTLWTDMNNEDRATMAMIRTMMNDFNCVKNSNKMSSYRYTLPDPDNAGQHVVKFNERPATFMPDDAVEEHYKFRRGLDEVLELHPNLPTVVVGHHAPSKLSTHPRYQNEKIMNGAYSSDLNNYILDRRQIKLWTHGHTHEEFDYMLGTTRIVCNPRGYDGYEDRADSFTLKYVDIT